MNLSSNVSNEAHSHASCNNIHSLFIHICETSFPVGMLKNISQKILHAMQKWLFFIHDQSNQTSYFSFIVYTKAKAVD